MAINFPDSPSNGDTHTAGGKTFTYDSTVGAWSPVGATTFIELTDTPSSYGTASQIPAINSGANALEFIALPSSVTVYATVDLLPLSGNNAGDQALVTATNRLYIWNGSGWYNIALINTTPSISGVSSSYNLAIDGTATVITVTATDPEGLPITYSIASDTSGSIATVTQGTGANSNVFTITPSTDANDNGTFSLTFRASDDVNIATAPASFTLNISTLIENSKYTTALITSVGGNNADNNDFVDSSTSNHTITAHSNATQLTFSPYRHGGYSTYFDGVGDVLIIADDASLDFGTGDFTLECWINLPTNSTVYPVLFGNDNWYIQTKNSDSKLAFWTGSNEYIYTGSSLATNTWHHIAVARSGSTLKIFLNGTEVLSVSNSDNIQTGANGVHIGRFAGAAGFDFKGYMTDVRVIKGTALYTSNFTPPTERLTAITNTSLLACHLPYIADGSTNGHTITVNGNTKTEPFAPYDYETYSASVNAGSLHCAGTNRLTMPDSADFDFGSGDFTIECWFMDTNGNRTNTQNGLFNQSAGGATSDSAFFFGAGNNGLSMYLSTSGSSWTHSAVTNVAPQVNTWAHIVWQRSGNTLQMYLNGVLQTVTAGSSSFTGTIFNSSRVVEVASQNDQSWVVGLISDFRVVKGTAVYSSNFTPPTAPLTAITNTKLLLPFDDAGIIDKSQSVQTLTLNGNVKSSTAQTKYLSSSMYFDGTGDYIQTPISDSFTFGSGDFTVEGWFYTTSTGAYQYIFDGRNGGTDVTYLYLNNGTGLYAGYGNINDSSVTTLSLNQWYHFAYVRNGSGTNNITVYIDGTAVWQITNTTNLSSTTRITLGSRYTGADYFGGYLSDIRVTKGLARYTANFTPPTAALGG